MLRAAAILWLLLAHVAAAQSADTAISAPALQRARQLFAEGKVVDARRIIDSVLRAAPADTPAFADALHLRATNAATAADAERDYRRILIEAPLSPRAEDAMLKLADLQEARGDRRGASDHLQRFLLTYARHPARPRVALSLVRLLFEQGPQQLARACESLKIARDEVPAGNAEMRNQLEFYGPRCAYAEASAPAPDTSPAPARDTTPRRSTARPPASSPSRTSGTAGQPGSGTTTSRYSVQLAAYDSAEPAERLATLLKSRGIDARVDGATRPFRVRVGRYATRAEAARAQATLRSQGHNGFIAVVR